MKRLCVSLLMILLLFGWAFPVQAKAGEAPAVQLVKNPICPVSDMPVAGPADNPTFTSDYKGYRIGFMCPVCKGKFDKADEVKKLAWLNKALAKVGKPPVK
jgi:hypothetical protein